jgi:hypothetical protein
MKCVIAFGKLIGLVWLRIRDRWQVVENTILSSINTGYFLKLRIFWNVLPCS